jgi:hypothetical protein
VRLERSLLGGQQALVVITDREHFDPGGRCREVVDSLNSTHVASYPDFDVWQVHGEAVTALAPASSFRSSSAHQNPSVAKMAPSSPQRLAVRTE